MASRVVALVLLVALLVTTSGLGLLLHERLDHDDHRAVAASIADGGATKTPVKPAIPHRAPDDCPTCAGLLHFVAIVAALVALIALVGRVAPFRAPPRVRACSLARPSPRSTRGPPMFALAVAG